MAENTAHLDTIRAGYTFDGATLTLGAAVVDGQVHADAPVRLPLAMMNRHGLIAGATGTGKTKSLQMIAEQLSTAGVPCSSPTSRVTSPASPPRASPRTS